MTRRPNIIYLNSHDTGRFVQPMGYRVETPHLQALAERGILFRDAHCAAPTCSPSRAALCTGEAAHSCGVIGLAHRGFGTTKPEHHLATTLSAAGYHCASWGMANNHMGGSGQDLGYAEHLPGSGTDPDGDRSVIDFLRRDHAQPFFLSISHTLTHRANGPGFFTEPDRERDDPRYTLPPAPYADTPEHREDWAWMASDVRELDRRYGLVLDALREVGLEDDTLVIATTDHGVPFPECKCSLTSRGTGVFLIVAGPGGFTGGQVRDQLVTQLDVFPTVCDVADIQHPEWLQGRSLQPLAAEADAAHHDAIFAEVTYHAAYEPKRMVRTKRHCYIRRFGDRRRPVLPNCDRSQSKDSWLAHGYAEQELPAEELYDHFFDSAEVANRIADPGLAEVADELRARLERWMRETDDPLLAGEVPPRPGSTYNPADGRDPSDPPIEVPA